MVISPAAVVMRQSFKAYIVGYHQLLCIAASDKFTNHNHTFAVVYKALFKHRPKRLILDLSGVGFMDSSGLGLILGRCALCEELGAAVHLESPSLRVRKVLAVAGIDRLQNLTVNA